MKTIRILNGSNGIGRAFAALSALTLALSLSVAVMAQTTYSMSELGAANCTAYAINDAADVVGQCDQAAVVWHSGVATSLGKLAGGNYSYATAINSKGVVVGDGDTGNFRPQSWVATSSGLLNIFPNNGGNTHAVFVGENGVIGGYYTKSLSGNVSSWKGAIWTPDPKDPRKYRTTDLPVLPGGINIKASVALPSAFNQLGQAAGYAQTDVIGQHASFWNNDTAHSIRDWSSLAWGMNDLGEVVGESHPPFGSRPVLWDNDAAHTAIELPLLAGDNYGSATATNNLGHILGSSAYGTPGTWDVGPSRFVIWRDGGVFELQSLIDPVTSNGWTITSVSGINNLGQIIGFGSHNGQPTPFLMSPLAP
jgi:uncharacterized membrane protein